MLKYYSLHYGYSPSRSYYFFVLLAIIQVQSMVSQQRILMTERTATILGNALCQLLSSIIVKSAITALYTEDLIYKWHYIASV